MNKNTLSGSYNTEKNPLKHYFRIMRIASILLFVFLFCLHAENSNSQNSSVTISKSNARLDKILEEIESQTDYLFIYNQNVNVNKNASLKVSQKPVTEVLEALFNGTNITYSVEGTHIVLSVINEKQQTVAVSQQKKSITGVVTDEKGEVVIGANVVEKGTTNGVITDLDGNFSLEVQNKAVIVISYIGYTPQEITITNQSKLAVKLIEDSKNLEEVVVTALGIKRSEKGLGYAVQKISGDKINVVKGVDAASGLVGKVAGLNVQSSTEFNEAPTLSLRGENPLLVIDGVPYSNISLRDIASDDIESMNVLKGATASALYGSRGGSGAIIVTTKKGNSKGGLQVSINSNTMFEAGHLALPEVQTAYSSGGGGQYRPGDFVWGDRLDIGRTAEQYNPYTQKKEMMALTSKGKNNLQNFLETGWVTNNNVSISHQGENGSFRTSLTHVYNKGQYPNSKLNKLTYTVGGDMKVGKFSFEGNMIYNKRFYPNNTGTGYGTGGYIYNLLVWSGSEFDIRDYKNYWIPGQEGIQQNWMDTNWYDNPYFIANEKRHSDDYDVTNGFLSAKYDINSWLNVTLRSGFDYYSDKEEWKYAQSTIGYKKGYYSIDQENAFSSNTDLLVMANHKFGKFGIDAMAGGTIYFRQGSNVWGKTNNGLSIPEFYSLNASVDPASTGQSGYKKQVNSIYGKATLSWESMLFVDVTARNDWSSSLPETTRSYFYPSVAGSFVLSEVINMPSWIGLLKIRGSWTKTKNDIGIYDTNNNYSISNNVWNGLNAAYYPGTIRGLDLRPESSRSYEVGTSANFLQNRLWVDLTYYNKHRYDFAVKAPLSEASGFSNVYVNSSEVLERKGVELSLGGVPFKTKDFEWNSMFNWSLNRQIYKKLDPVYSSKEPWIKEGGRTDIATTSHYIWNTDFLGNIVHGTNGLPESVRYRGMMGYSSPDWIWGFSNSFKYKGFTLDVSIDGSVGGVAYNRTEQAMWNSGSHINSDNFWRYDEVVNGNKNYIGWGVKVISGTVERDKYGSVISDSRVFALNDKKVSYEDYVRIWHGDSYESAPQNFFDKTYLKLREVAISYTLPSAISQKAGMNNLTVGVVGNNLLLWTKEFKYSDPDKGSDNLNSPSIRYVGFNLKLSF